MSLFSSLQLAGNSLRASQVGLQVVGQNISNANTPGYIREDVSYSPAPAQKIGQLSLGLGVQVDGVVQHVDNLLEQRLRIATSDRANAEVQEQTYQQLESVTSELNNTGLSKSLSDFVGSINGVLNQPEDAAARNLAILKGQTLTSTVNGLTARTDEIRNDLNNQIGGTVSDINRLTTQIASLNLKISQTEAGNSVQTPAVGLRDQRNTALGQLSELIDVNVQEQSDGSVAVYNGGDYLVFGADSRSVALYQTNQGDQLKLADTGSTLHASSGKLTGLITSRDQIIGGFQSSLDDFAKNLAFEFNKVFSSGQGLNGYQSVTSQSAVTNANQPLDAAGLANTPVNGGFQLLVYNKSTGLTQTTNISVTLNGLDHDTSLADLANQLNAVDGVSASIGNGKLTIASTGSDRQIAFGNDTSGALAALGINTFFTGSDARSLSINQAIATDPGKFAASKGGIGADTGNAVDLAAILDRPLDSQNNATLTNLHDRMMANTTQASAQASSVADGYRTFESSLQGQSLAISGVNIDEEAIKMLTFQRTFQASAKFLSTVNDLLGVLMQI